MAKKKAARATRPAAPRGNYIPKPVDDGAATEFNPFLKAQQIGRLGATAVLELTGETRIVDGGFGEQIVCEARLGRVLYDWPIKVDSPNHRMLFERFGQNPKKWRGKVNVEIKNFQNRDYIAVSREGKRSR